MEDYAYEWGDIYNYIYIYIYLFIHLKSDRKSNQGCVLFETKDRVQTPSNQCCEA